MNKNILLIVAGLLILIGLTKPDLSKFLNNSDKINKPNIVELEQPSNETVKKECEDVAKILRTGLSADAIRLRDLYIDLANLIELDGNDLVIKDTEAIRQANSLAGTMLKLDIKDKYKNLATETKEIIVAVIGDDSIPLSTELRKQAASAFRYLAWACNEGSK